MTRRNNIGFIAAAGLGILMSSTAYADPITLYEDSIGVYHGTATGPSINTPGCHNVAMYVSRPLGNGQIVDIVNTPADVVPPSTWNGDTSESHLLPAQVNTLRQTITQNPGLTPGVCPAGTSGNGNGNGNNPPPGNNPPGGNFPPANNPPAPGSLCPSGMQWDAPTTSCVCPLGTITVGSSCTTVPPRGPYTP